jgi:hypothetical protein
LLAYVTLDQDTEIEAKSATLAKDIPDGVAGTGIGIDIVTENE